MTGQIDIKALSITLPHLVAILRPFLIPLLALGADGEVDFKGVRVAALSNLLARLEVLGGARRANLNRERWQFALSHVLPLTQNVHEPISRKW